MGGRRAECQGGIAVAERLYWEPEIETASRQKMREIQTAKLKAVVRKAYHDTVFYRRKFAEAGIRPDDIETLEDLKKIPFTRYLEDFVAAPVHEKLAIPRGMVERIISTSGTISGSPQLVMLSEGDLRTCSDLFLRQMLTHGIGKGDILQPLLPLVFQEGVAARLGFTLVPFSHVTLSMDNAIKLMNSARPTAVIAGPSQFLAMARRAKEMGIDMKQSGLRVVEFAGESWSNAYRQRMERDWGIGFYDTYGATETGIVALECSQKTGMHYWEDMMIVEIVDPETGRTLGPGQLGEIVVTSLYREAMPLLRYRMGDVAAWLPYVPCGCGRTFAKISRIKGRREHMVRVGEARVFPVDVEEVIHGSPELTGEYQIMLRKPGVQEVLEVSTEYHPGTGGLQELAARLERALETSTGARSKFSLVPSGKIPAGLQFKAQRITKA